MHDKTKDMFVFMNDVRDLQVSTTPSDFWKINIDRKACNLQEIFILVIAFLFY